MSKTNPCAYGHLRASTAKKNRAIKVQNRNGGNEPLMPELPPMTIVVTNSTITVFSVKGGKKVTLLSRERQFISKQQEKRAAFQDCLNKTKKVKVKAAA